MTERRTRGPAGQPPGGYSISVAAHPDGSRALTIYTPTEAQYEDVARRLYRGDPIALSPVFIAALLAQGVITPGTKPPRITRDTAPQWRAIIAEAKAAAVKESGKATYETTAGHLAHVGITSARTLKDYTRDLKRIADYDWRTSY
jgi:hypothetical protein